MLQVPLALLFGVERSLDQVLHALVLGLVGLLSLLLEVVVLILPLLFDLLLQLVIGEGSFALLDPPDVQYVLLLDLLELLDHLGVVEVDAVLHCHVLHLLSWFGEVQVHHVAEVLSGVDGLFQFLLHEFRLLDAASFFEEAVAFLC